MPGWWAWPIVGLCIGSILRGREGGGSPSLTSKKTDHVLVHASSCHRKRSSVLRTGNNDTPRGRSSQQPITPVNHDQSAILQSSTSPQSGQLLPATCPSSSPRSLIPPNDTRSVESHLGGRRPLDDLLVVSDSLLTIGHIDGLGNKGGCGSRLCKSTSRNE